MADDAVVYRLEFDWIPPAEVRGNSRAHPQAKARLVAEMRKGAYWRAREQALGMALDQASIKYIYHNSLSIDDDNFITGMKPILDGIVDAGLIVDDRPEHCRIETPEFIKCKRGMSHTVVEIRAVEA